MIVDELEESEDNMVYKCLQLHLVSNAKAKQVVKKNI